MEGRRKPKGENYRRSRPSRKPPRGSWQPAVPSWEKDFCKVIGSFDWETLLHMKKFTHLYSNVMNWNDSAGEEAICSAKKRYWARINNLPCDIPLPDPDLCIDTINWDSETERELPPDIECNPLIPNTGDSHDPVVIFGDSLLPNQVFLSTGWGDEEEKNLEVPANPSSANYGFSESLMANQVFQPTGWGDFEEKLEVPVNQSPANYGDPWMQNWGNSVNTGAAAAWADYSDNSWQFSNPAGYVSWDGNWNKTWGWGSYVNSNDLNYVRPDIEGEKQGYWNDTNATLSNAGRQVSSHNTQKNHQGKGRHRNHTNKNDDRGQHKSPQSGVDKRSTPRKWNSINSCGAVERNAAITVGQAWNP